jgi:hypothetical protein
MDFEELEKADVLRGLRTFAEKPEYRRRLKEVYRGLPSELKALGEEPEIL